MIFVKNSRGGREVNMINILSKINLSKIGWEEGGSTSIWIMPLNILFVFFRVPLMSLPVNSPNADFSCQHSGYVRVWVSVWVMSLI